MAEIEKATKIILKTIIYELDRNGSEKFGLVNVTTFYSLDKIETELSVEMVKLTVKFQIK